MTKCRSFSIVLHNVKDDSKSSVENHFQATSPLKLLVAMEPYSQDEGHHIHVFVSYKCPRSFKSMLTSTESFSKLIVTEKPEGETRSWGRVQVDQMRGTFEQATAYLTNPQKDKVCDTNVTSIDNDPTYEDSLYNYELASKMMNRVSWYPTYGSYLKFSEFISKEKSSGHDLDPFYEQIFLVHQKGRPIKVT